MVVTTPFSLTRFLLNFPLERVRHFLFITKNPFYLFFLLGSPFFFGGFIFSKLNEWAQPQVNGTDEGRKDRAI
jgi:hypothetical protein